MIDPPLLEVLLLLRFENLELSEERLRFFSRADANSLSGLRMNEKQIYVWTLPDQSGDVRLQADALELRSSLGISIPRLRSSWFPILESFVDIFEIQSFQEISLSYLNEIPIQDLKEFASYLNIGFQLPSLLQEKFELFRSEFTFKYDFADIHVRLQPEWNEKLDSYALQFMIESRRTTPILSSDSLRSIEQLHESNKEVFHQILSREYIAQLPQ